MGKNTSQIKWSEGEAVKVIYMSLTLVILTHCKNPEKTNFKNYLNILNNPSLDHLFIK
ncbi:hypothetical protein J2799_001131 [Chryseobacterium vietnamense]|nr:hypothetical protein [Chryseobacterium vietnamense]